MMTIRFSVALTSALFLAACQSPTAQSPAPAIGVPYRLNNAETAAVIDGVRQKLKDPYSSRVDGIRASKDTNGTVRACGYVNAKNSFGAYTGAAPFMGVMANNRQGEPTFVVLTSWIGQNATAKLSIAEICRRHGISF